MTTEQMIEELFIVAGKHKNDVVGVGELNIHAMCIDVAQRLKELSEQTNTKKWIPCSERLPEEAGFYIVTKRQKSGEIQVALGSYRPLFNEWSGNGNFKDVLAWMPLPEQYKAGDT